MKFIKNVLPHLTISTALALIVVTILNEFNPLMGFLQSRQATVLIVVTCILAVTSGLMLYLGQLNNK